MNARTLTPGRPHTLPVILKYTLHLYHPVAGDTRSFTREVRSIVPDAWDTWGTFLQRIRDLHRTNDPGCALVMPSPVNGANLLQIDPLG